ncbi:methyl-accepting chemotaxis protein [Stratiformator vulcanicus]|uniref:HAMP domain-containing protein n=1 Tax=Stratiformator vulcanicus TaxID=2527980 RepID=A0A517R3K4_9PLAN|nr:methyl-accepting chemotaxis protein [Stratiformator vulcanicus]QDT38461.1 hypothetical protein Pan189_28550 [Stratiformator vulcanicus]
MNDSSPTEKPKRTKRFVSWEIQGQTIKHVLAYWFIYHAVLWHAIFLFDWLNSRGKILTGERPLMFRDLYAQFVAENCGILICAVLLLPILVIDVVRLSHKVAGPLVRFQNALAELSKGRKVEPIRLRDGDWLGQFETSFNEFLASQNVKTANGRSAEPKADTDKVLESVRQDQADRANEREAPLADRGVVSSAGR